MGADRILVMKDGSIIEDGPHDDLIRLKGNYFELWKTQASNPVVVEPDTRIP
jgi:ABC-type multidrug transport system fused ATPase/permease subunit